MILRKNKLIPINHLILLVLIAMFSILFFIFLHIPSATAHSTLLEMEPAERVVIEKPPEELKLRFNEPVEHELAYVTIFDGNAKPVYTGNPDGDVGRSPLLEFSLPSLEKGTYTVKWNIVSADGHPVGGTYTFAVGEATKGAIKDVGQSDGSDLAIIVSRSFTQGLIILSAGLIWFAFLANRRNFPNVNRYINKGKYIIGSLLIIGTIIECITYNLSLPPGLFQVIINGRWELLQQFPFIITLMIQLLCIILMLIPNMVKGWYLTMWFLLSLIPAFGGHVWGLENSFIALIPRGLHLLSIAFWLGGLLYIILLLIEKKHVGLSISWEAFRQFFLVKMIIASSLVILSGFAMMMLQSGFTAIINQFQTWSILIILKTILTLVMLCLALYQTFKWKKSNNFLTSGFIRLEWFIGLTIIVLGIWMSQIAYPIPVKKYDEALITDQLEVHLSINKLQTGERELTIETPKFEGEAPEKVIVEVSMPEHDMGSGELIANKENSDEYKVEVPFTMSGTWRIHVISEYAKNEIKEWQDDVFITNETN